MSRAFEHCPYELAEWTTPFEGTAIQYARSIRLDAVSAPLVRQSVRSSTSVGANHAEADSAGSRREFRYRIRLPQHEARQTKHWLRMLARAFRATKHHAR